MTIAGQEEVAANQRELKRLGSHARHNGVSGEAVAVETI